MNTTIQPSTSHTTKMVVLTNLQRKILQLSAEGRTVKEISQKMEMSEYIIVKFLYILLRKFQEIDTAKTIKTNNAN